MYFLLIFLPLIGSLFSLFFGRFLGKNGVTFLSTFLIVISFFLSLLVFFEVALSNCPCFFTLLPWINSDLFTPFWGFYFDTLTSIMLIVITFISMLVHIYSISYMNEDPHIIRFMSYLSLFTFFMLILVTSDNFLQLFVGWEGVGLCSYLLINFWFTRIQANKAAIKAMVVNRIGDLGLALGIILIYTKSKSVDFSTVFSLIPFFLDDFVYILNIKFNFLTITSLLLFIGCIGKSAQLGLHTWLPDAMEGPTPVSALIHAATMVTAGVFLLARCSLFFEYCPDILIIICIVGSLTSFFGASIALVQTDIKKVIAYSTCSQLGYMIFICGLSHYSIGIFHLFNHAFFKALLFLGAGSVIHAMNDEQDFRKMGGLRKILPFTYSAIVIGSFSLMGLPFLTGFYSKDAILEISFAKYTVTSHFSYFFGSFTAFFTSFYSVRLIYLTFLSSTNSFKNVIKKAHEPDIKMYFSFIFLIFCSIFIGYFFRDMFIGLGTSFWSNSIFILPYNLIAIDSEFLPTYIKLLPNFFVFGGAFLSLILYNYFRNFLYFIKLTNKFLFIFLNKKWFFDKLYNLIFVQYILNFSYIITYKYIDKGFLEIFGPTSITSCFYFVSIQLSKFHIGLISFYSFIFIYFLIFIFLIILLNLNIKLFLLCFILYFLLNIKFKFKFYLF